MSISKSKRLQSEVVLRALDEVWSQGNLDVLEELYDPAYIRHDPFLPGITGYTGLKTALQVFRTAFPDIKYSVVDASLSVSENHVSTQYWMRGTHKGHLMSIAATQRGFLIVGNGIWRFSEQRIIEEWQVCDTQTMLQALGVFRCIGDLLENKK